GYNCIFDEMEGLGPFGGVHAALHAARRAGRQAVLALSCDLPFMDASTLHRLLRARQARAATTLLTTFRQQETGFIEALTAIYEVKALPLFDQALRAGERKLSRIVAPARRTDIVYARHEALPFFNINYPADLKAARRLLAAL
ncbi:MAG: NTP transferase domain-containing protein, partial [Desulfovibrionaceae bacterium]|nr:NTP transferase domain-containing protein [Desulfovibrionaceae bacterium]